MADPIETKVRGVVADLMGVAPEAVGLDDILIGPSAKLKSRDLVMMFFEIEDFLMNDYNVEFNWTSDSAMSSGRSNFRTVGSLIEFVRERANGGA